MRKEFDKTTFSTNPVADEGSGGATFTKRFQDDIKKIYISFLKFTEREQIRLYFLQTCPNRRWTYDMVMKKKWNLNLTWDIRLSKMLKLFRVAKRVVTDDLNWDFERWYVIFPGNESRLPGHIYDAVELAREYSLKCYSQELEEQSKTYAECMATLEYPDTVDWFISARHPSRLCARWFVHFSWPEAKPISLCRKMYEWKLVYWSDQPYLACLSQNLVASHNCTGFRALKASMEKKLDTFEKMGVWRDVLSTKRRLPVTL